MSISKETIKSTAKSTKSTAKSAKQPTVKSTAKSTSPVARYSIELGAAKAALLREVKVLLKADKEAGSNPASLLLSAARSVAANCPGELFRCGVTPNRVSFHEKTGSSTSRFLAINLARGLFYSPLRKVLWKKSQGLKGLISALQS
jgi:hypothetical protein